MCGDTCTPTPRVALRTQVKAFGLTSRVRTSIVVGGVQMHEQRHGLRGGVEIVVATPGRFIDHLQQGNTNLARISFIVLDEADRMLDMGFEPQVRARPRAVGRLIGSPPAIPSLAWRTAGYGCGLTRASRESLTPPL
jgi:superfamily II DNA/RNA helicase